MQPSPRAETSRPLVPSLRFCMLFLLSVDAGRSLGLEARHVDREAVLDVRLEQPLVGLVDLLDGDDLDVGGDVVLAAEVEHLLRLRDAADVRAGYAAVAEDQPERREGERLCDPADERE